MVSAQRAATPGATEPTVRNAVRSIQRGGAVFTSDLQGSAHRSMLRTETRRKGPVTIITRPVICRHYNGVVPVGNFSREEMLHV
jgi:hypothetical protein